MAPEPAFDLPWGWKWVSNVSYSVQVAGSTIRAWRSEPCSIGVPADSG